MLNRAASKRNALWSLLASGLVLVLCWSQPLAAASLCPLKAELYERSVAEPEFAPILNADLASIPVDLNPEHGDCDLTEQWLQSQVFQADLFLPTCLLLLWLLIGLAAGKGGRWRLSEPIVPPRRRHLLFCVFRE